jgi:hypothetical protein
LIVMTSSGSGGTWSLTVGNTAGGSGTATAIANCGTVSQ